MKTTAIVLIISLFIPTALFANNSNCILANGINVSTYNKRLSICANGEVIKDFRVSLGTNGIDKKLEGDKKTPIGLYPLDVPRKSKRFGMFIPIQYPTLKQLADGYTGNNVGIHGPIQKYNWLGFLNTWFDWTHGCVAVGKNEQIEYIANWVATHPETQVLIT